MKRPELKANFLVVSNILRGGTPPLGFDDWSFYSQLRSEMMFGKVLAALVAIVRWYNVVGAM